jgi:flavorubredoxin
MMITNQQSGTNVAEVARGIYRINTPIDLPGGAAFSFNQYLIDDDEPLLFHTGPRRLFPLVREAIATLLPPEALRWIAFSHVEADECGSLNEWLAAAPSAQPLCGSIAALVSVTDLADRTPRGLVDGETISLGDHKVRWFDAPHVPHGWECGYLADETTRTLFCGDLFTQPGSGQTALVESDILGPSEAFRAAMDYYSDSRRARPILEKLAAFEPDTLACMHGSSWRGDGGAMLMQLADAFGA